MVRAVVDQLREQDLNPSEWVSSEYPRSFADVDPNGESVGDGCCSLLMLIKTGVEDKNSNNALIWRTHERRSNSERGNLSRVPVEQYGCVRGESSDLLLGETEVT